MTKIAISPNVNGTGTFTLAAPNSNTDRTLTLPDAEGSVVLNEGSGTFKIDSSGRVGIGTAEPQCSLQVNGGIRARGGAPGGSGASNNGYAFSGNGGDNDSGMFSLSDGTVDFFTNNVSRININSAGNVGIGEGPSGSRVRVHRNNPSDFANSHLELLSSAGNVHLAFHAGGASAVNIRHSRGVAELEFVNSNITAHIPIRASSFIVTSDYRIKENITPLTGAADRLMQLPVHRFSFLEGSMSYQGGAVVDGFIAHEVQAIVPEAVTGAKDEVNDEGEPVYQGIDQSKLVPLLTAALQEALADIATLKAEVAALKGVPA